MATTEGKVAQLEDEFETVKLLLASAASYAESSSRKIDLLSNEVRDLARSTDQAGIQLQAAQAKTDAALQAYITESRESQAKTDAALQAYITENQQAQTRLEAAQTKTEQTLENFVVQVERLIGTLGDRIVPLEGRLERLEGIVRFLLENEQKAAAQRAQATEERQQLNQKFDETISQMAEDRKQAAIERQQERERVDKKFNELLSQMAEDRKQAAVDRTTFEQRTRAIEQRTEAIEQQAEADRAEFRQRMEAFEQRAEADRQRAEADRTEFRQRAEADRAEMRRIWEYLMAQQQSGN